MYIYCYLHAEDEIAYLGYPIAINFLAKFRYI